MASEIVNASAAIYTLLSGITGLTAQADNPPEKAAGDPFLIVWPNNVEWTSQSAGMVKGLPEWTIGVYKVRKNLAQDYDKMLPFGDLVKDKLFDPANIASLLTTLSGFPQDGSLSATFGDAGELGDVPIFGWTFKWQTKINSVHNGTSFAKG